MAYSADSTLYLFTSLTAGSSHIITATSRLETILKANKVPFRALDVATDEKARMLWGRRSKGRKLPGLVRYGNVVGDLEQIEEWNEYGELKEQIDNTYDSSTPPTSNPVSAGLTLRPEPPASHVNQPTTPIERMKPQRPSGPPSRASSETRHISITEPTESEKEKARTPSVSPAENPMMMAMKQLGAEAAAKGQGRKVSGDAMKSKNNEATSPAAVPTQSPTAASTAQIPTPATTKMSPDALDPSVDPEMTAGKAPSQLAAEGATTAVDKIDATSLPTPSTSSESNQTDSSIPELKDPFNKPGEAPSATKLAPSADMSTEQQTLDLRKNSTLARQPSALQQTQSVDEAADAASAEPAAEGESATETTEPAAETSAQSEAGKPDMAGQTELETPKGASKDDATDIQAEARDPNDEDTETGRTERVNADTNNVSAAEHSEGQKPQETKTKDPDAAGESVGD